MKTWLNDQPSTFYLSNVFHRVEYDGRTVLRFLRWADARQGIPEGEPADQARHDLVAEYLGLPAIDWAQVMADRALVAAWEARRPQPFEPLPGEAAYGIVKSQWWSGEVIDQDWEEDEKGKVLLYRTLDEALYALPGDDEDFTYEAEFYPFVAEARA